MSGDYEILTDYSKRGRERPWKKHKTNSLLLSESFARLNKLSKADRVCNCGSSLKFNVCPSGHEKRLAWSNFCRVRLCPMCSWRRSLLVAHQIKSVAHGAVTGEDMEGNKLSIQPRKMRWLFLTLTIKNCAGDDLPDTISRMMKAWNNFVRRKEFKAISIGWFRSLEVTQNYLNKSYHPHFHVLVGVSPSYFKGKDYLTTERISELWQSCLKVDYTPITHVRIVKGKRSVENEIRILEEKGIEVGESGFSETDLSGSAVAELAKYATKSEDFLIYNKYEYKNVDRKGKMELLPDLESGIDEERTDESVSVLDTSLSSRRLLAYGGLLKEVWEELEAAGKVQDAEDDKADLVHVDDNSKCTCGVCGSNMLEELYSWIPGVHQYIKKENHQEQQ